MTIANFNPESFGYSERELDKILKAPREDRTQDQQTLVEEHHRWNERMFAEMESQR